MKNIIMSNQITELIINFKEALMGNYYSKTNEKDKFLQWLESTINYSNGSYSILEEELITESEQESFEGNPRLKNMVKSWSRSKVEKQEYWNDFLNGRLSYLNGTFCLDKINDKYVQQTVTGEFSYELYYNGKYYYYLEINVAPGVSGQSFSFSPEFNVYRVHQTSVGCYGVEITSDTIINEPVTLIAESFLKDNTVVYSGGRIVVNPTNL